MAITVTSVTELWDARTSELGEDGTRTATRAFLVKLNTAAPGAGELDAIEAIVESSLPVALYGAHPAYGWCLARGFKVTREGLAHDTWKGVVSYSSAPFPAGGDGTGDPASPTGGGSSSPSASNNRDTPADDRPPEVRIRRKEYKKLLEKDATTGNPVVNAAGDPFDPPVEVERSRIQYELTFYRAPVSFDWAARSSFWDRINDAPVELMGISHATHTLKVQDLSHEGIWDKGAGGALAFFWKITAVLEYKPDTWKVKLLNAGRREKTGSMGTGFKVTNITDATGATVTDPVPLNGSGERLAVGAPYVYLEFDGYEDADFTSLFA